MQDEEEEEESSFDEHIWYNKIQSRSDLQLHDGFQPTCSKMEEDLLEEHHGGTAVSCHQPCCPINSNVEGQHMDCLLFYKDKRSYVLDDMTKIKYLWKPPCFPYESQQDLMQTDHLFKNMGLDSQQIPSDMHGMESSIYANSCPSASSPLLMVPMIKDVGDAMHNNEERNVEEVIFLAECVLHELEIVISRLTYKTRICLRDALYHMAKNTSGILLTKNLQRSFSMEEGEGAPPSWAEEDEKTRTRWLEMEASTINGVVTMLLFRPLSIHS